MTVAALLRFANTQTKFPIHIDTIIDWIKENTAQDEIEIIKVGIDRSKLLGIFKQYSRHATVYGDPTLVTQIIYPHGLDPEMERLVVCKELLHIFDKPEQRVTTSAQLDDLVNGIILQKFNTGSFDAVFNDFMGPFLALAVLIPPTARRRFIDAIVRKELTSAEIASFVGLPHQYVSVYLSTAVEKPMSQVFAKHNCSDMFP